MLGRRRGGGGEEKRNKRQERARTSRRREGVRKVGPVAKFEECSQSAEFDG